MARRARSFLQEHLGRFPKSLQNCRTLKGPWSPCTWQGQHCDHYKVAPQTTRGRCSLICSLFDAYQSGSVCLDDWPCQQVLPEDDFEVGRSSCETVQFRQRRVQGPVAFSRPVQHYKILQVVPGRAGGESSTGKRTIKQRKNLPNRVWARRPASAMPKPSFLRERAFCRSTVVMSCALIWCVVVSWGRLHDWGRVAWLVVRWPVVS